MWDQNCIANAFKQLLPAFTQVKNSYAVHFPGTLNAFLWSWFSVFPEEAKIVLHSLCIKRCIIEMNFFFFPILSQLNFCLTLGIIESLRWKQCKRTQNWACCWMLCSSSGDLYFKHLSKEALVELLPNWRFLLCFLRCLLNSHYVWWGLWLPHKISGTWWLWSRKDQPSLPIYRWQI